MNCTTSLLMLRAVAENRLLRSHKISFQFLPHLAVAISDRIILTRLSILIPWHAQWMEPGNVSKSNFVVKKITSVGKQKISTMLWCAISRLLTLRLFAKWRFKRRPEKNLRSKCSIRILSAKWRKLKEGAKRRLALGLKKAAFSFRLSSRESLRLERLPREI